jgi:hypothetical protein
MPFLRENTVLTVYGGRPPLGRRHVFNLSPGPCLIVVRDTGAQGCNGTSFPTSLYKYIYLNVYYSHLEGQKKKKER